MKINLTDYLSLVKVIRMLYGVELADEFFQSTYKKFGFEFSISRDKIELPRDTNNNQKGK